MELDHCGGVLVQKSRGADGRLSSAEQLYIACRVTTLAAAVTQMTGFNFTTETSCKVCRDHRFFHRRVDSDSHRYG